MVPDAGRTMSAAPSIESGALARAFAERGERALLAAFMTAGFPARDDTGDALEALAAGADIIEVGAPFSDPAADGTAIQRASERALANGMTLRLALSQIRAFRARRRTPIVVMGYANSFLAHCRAAANKWSIRFGRSRRRFGGGGRERHYRRRFGGFRRRSVASDFARGGR